MDKIKIGNFLKELREDRGLTQIQLSQKLVEDGGYSDALISKWERGQALPNIDDLKRLAKYFGVSVDEILNGTRNKEEDLEQMITKKAGLWLDGGGMFGKEGRGFQRINIACPRTTLQNALIRLRDAIREI